MANVIPLRGYIATGTATAGNVAATATFSMVLFLMIPYRDFSRLLGVRRGVTRLRVTNRRHQDITQMKNVPIFLRLCYCCRRPACRLPRRRRHALGATGDLSPGK